MRTEINPLTYDDVEAFRQARTLVFFADSEGRAKIRASHEKDDPADYTRAEARIFSTPSDWRPGERSREFLCDGFARAYEQSGPDNPLAGKRLIGSYCILGSQFHHAIRTVGKILRRGMGVELQFFADYATTTNHKKVGFHGDVFTLRLWTPVDTRDGWELGYEFHIDTSVGPHDSARLVRAEGDVSQATTTLNIDDFWNTEVLA